MRVTLDHTSPLYNQRTSVEHINSQAKELGIEHPKVHTMRSVQNLNPVIRVSGHSIPLHI